MQFHNRRVNNAQRSLTMPIIIVRCMRERLMRVCELTQRCSNSRLRRLVPRNIAVNDCELQPVTREGEDNILRHGRSLSNAAT